MNCLADCRLVEPEHDQSLGGFFNGLAVHNPEQFGRRPFGPKGEAAFDEATQAAASAMADANFEYEAECAKIEKLEEKLKETEEKLKEAERLRLLALAEMDNQRKRLAKEMEQESQSWYRHLVADGERHDTC